MRPGEPERKLGLRFTRARCSGTPRLVLLTHLGHAMWLAEIGALRVLFDPLLDSLHHGGVFEVFPPRRILAEELRADFIVVSHRHPDHFDPTSLARLAELDPDSVVLTSDALVTETAKELGFNAVRTLATWDRVRLSEGELLTTPSFTSETEWGVMLRDDESLVWNQVDCVMRSPSDVSDVLERASAAFGSERLRVDLALVRWQPLLEVAALIGERAGFPYAEYAGLLDQIAAIDARVLMPAAAGARHAAPFAHMNRLTHPVSESRFLRDIAARAPRSRARAPVLGARYRVDRAGTVREPGLTPLAELEKAQDDRVFRPFELPPIADGGGSDVREACADWVSSHLGPALERTYFAMARERPWSFVLEVVTALGTDAFTLRVGPNGATLSAEFDPDYDVLNSIAGSRLAEVVRGERHWGDVLLAGDLRASLRAYRVSESGLQRANVAPIFLYYALSYEESVRRATRFLVAELTRRAAAP